MNEKRGAGLQNPVPRFRQWNGAAKIRAVKGLRVEIFPPYFAGKYYPPLDGLDRRNGWM